MINISYENKINLAFDKPLEYKGIYIYPATLPYYSIFLNAEECLDVSRLNERDIKLLRLPYLEYLYEKSLKDENFKSRWDMLICILNIVLKDQSFEIVKENNNISLKVYQRTKEFETLNSEYEDLKKNIINKYNETHNIEGTEMTKLLDGLSDFKKKMFKVVSISGVEFDDFRQLVMLQNDIKSEHYSPKIEKMLNETKMKLNSVNKKGENLSLEDLITAVAYTTHIKPEDMYEMTIRRFNRFLYITKNKDDYYLYKQLELSGNIELKTDLPYWIKHYEPVGKYDDVLINNSSLLSSVQDGKI